MEWQLVHSVVYHTTLQHSYFAMEGSAPKSYKRMMVVEQTFDYRKAVAIVETETPDLKDTEVLVKNRYLGVNASDKPFAVGRYKSYSLKLTTPIQRQTVIGAAFMLFARFLPLLLQIKAPKDFSEFRCCFLCCLIRNFLELRKCSLVFIIKRFCK